MLINAIIFFGLHLYPHDARAVPPHACEPTLSAGLITTTEFSFDAATAFPWDKLAPAKRRLFEIILNGRTVEPGRMAFSRHQLALTNTELDALPIPNATVLRADPGVYAYPATGEDTFAVYVNFADPELFGFWASDLFAQDEVQVAEHPALAALREVESPTLNIDLFEVAMVTDVPRMASIATDQIYGSALAEADRATLRRSVTRLEDGPRSNILAMAAKSVPRHLEGQPYQAADVRDHFVTALTAFTAAKVRAGSRHLEIYTGNWGTGAFGNDPELMALVQILAARVAGVDRMVYHTVSADRHASYIRAVDWLDQQTLRESRATVGTGLRALIALGRRYGRGNGT